MVKKRQTQKKQAQEVRVMADPFESDYIRAALVERGDVRSLVKTYGAHGLPDFPSMNTPAKWDELAWSSTTSEHPHTKRRIALVRSLIDPTTSIIDIGVGYGDILGLIAKTHPEVSYTGIDFSPVFIEKLDERYGALSHASFRVGSTHEYSDGVFETAISMEVMEHISASEIRGFLAEVRRVLQPNGIFVVSVPTYEDLRAITIRCSSCGALQNPNGHVRRYTPALLRAELELAGFAVDRVIPMYMQTGLRYATYRLATALLRRPYLPSNVIIRARVAQV
ncbi:MAG: class I SAM-dependent methyltransferase [Patescibacteria group bacterium]